MPSTKLSNALTSAIAKAVRIELAAHGIEAKHSHILTGIAHGLGFENANAMRALAPDMGGRAAKSAPPAALMPAPGKDATTAGYRTSFLIEVLSNEDDVAPNEIEHVLTRMTEGDCIGMVTQLDVTPLTRPELDSETARMGSDIDFFDAALEDAQDEHDA